MCRSWPITAVWSIVDGGWWWRLMMIVRALCVLVRDSVGGRQEMACLLWQRLSPHFGVAFDMPVVHRKAQLACQFLWTRWLKWQQPRLSTIRPRVWIQPLEKPFLFGSSIFWCGQTITQAENWELGRILGRESSGIRAEKWRVKLFAVPILCPGWKICTPPTLFGELWCSATYSVCVAK